MAGIVILCRYRYTQFSEQKPVSVVHHTSSLFLDPSGVFALAPVHYAIAFPDGRCKRPLDIKAYRL